MPSKRKERRAPVRIARKAVGLAAFMWAQAALALTPFVVKDIRIEGVQRTEPGTVFGYLPVKVGDTMNDEKAAQAVKSLFATGFFKDVRLEAEGDVLVVHLEERPAIASVDVTGSKEFEKDALKRALRDQGLAESRIFDRSLLERAEQEIKRQYLSRGKYAVKVTTTVTPLERNRVGVAIAIEEGESARIKSIRIVGNKAFSESELLDQFRLSTPTWMSWYTKNDQYSREKLSGDLEALRSFYLNRGYLEFSIESTQVSITPDKEDVHLTLSLNEGKQYRLTDLKLGGNLLGREQEFRALMLVKPGDTYAGDKMSESTKRISDRLGELGYAFANVNAVPEIKRDSGEVSFTVLVDPGRRVYVRRINIVGNARTRDEVIRREMRQFEDAWYDAERIRISRERIDRLSYFKEVQLETQPVADAPDQVDLNVVVAEKPTGNIGLGIGLSSTEKVILSASLNQANFLGTGKLFRFEVNTSRLNRQAIVSLVDPYFTPDGISRSFDLYLRTFNAQALNLGNYQLRSVGVAMRFGIPYTEVDRVFLGLGVEGNRVKLGTDSPPPQRYVDFVNKFGDTAVSLLGTAGWTRDSRDSGFIPTRGQLQTANLEFTLPVGDLRYWKATYNNQWYKPLTRDVILALNGDLGVGRAFGGSEYPLFKNFYAGGIGTVRGYYPSSLGPGRDPVDNVALGGQTRIVGSVELQMPLPGTGKDRSFRTFVFADGGNVFPLGAVSLGDLRYSTGFGISWLSPFGPMKFSLGFPVRKREGDNTQRLQFQVGTGF
jgi:outer membrane protein insertion porin family